MIGRTVCLFFAGKDRSSDRFGLFSMRQVDAATSPTIPRTHLPLTSAYLAQMQLLQSDNPGHPNTFTFQSGPSFNAQQHDPMQSQPQTRDNYHISLPTYLQLCSLPSNRKTQRVQSALDTNHNHSQTLQQSHLYHQSSNLSNPPHQSITQPTVSLPTGSAHSIATTGSACRVCLAIRLNSGQCAPTGAFIPSAYLPSTGQSIAQTHHATIAAPAATVTVSHSAPQDRALSAAPVLQINERSLSLSGSAGNRSQGPSPLPNCSSSLQRSHSARRHSGRSALTISPAAEHSAAYASSIGGDSQVESPTTAYLDNNDSVNIFAKYQMPSSSAALSSAPFANHFLYSPKRHGCFRRSVPTMPLLVAIVLCIVNWFLPGAGKQLPTQHQDIPNRNEVTRNSVIQIGNIVEIRVQKMFLFTWYRFTVERSRANEQSYQKTQKSIKCQKQTKSAEHDHVKRFVVSRCSRPI